MSRAWQEFLNALQGIEAPYVIRRSRISAEKELAAMAAVLGQPLPPEYSALVREQGLLYLTTPSPVSPSSHDPEIVDPDPLAHVVDCDEVGRDYWFSFFHPKHGLESSAELRAALREDYQDAAMADRLERAVIFQQAYGDFAFYLFVAGAEGVEVCLFDSGDSGEFFLEARSSDFVSHMRDYARRWRTIERL